MGISLSGKKKELISGIPEQNYLSVVVKQSVGLQFKNGYEFTITKEGDKMIISACTNGQETFYLDEIPEQFIESLRRMLL